MAAPPSNPSHPVRLVVTDDRRRNRVAVFFRFILCIPHFVWLALWSIAAFFAVIANWFATLFAGRPPEGLHRFLAAFVRYGANVAAYVSLTADPFPGFRGEARAYPIDLEIAGPERQNRAATAFRAILVIPAFILAWVLSIVNLVTSFAGWFVCLVLGRMPTGMRDLSAYCVRYVAQTHAYIAVLTARYPSLGAESPQHATPSPGALAPAATAFSDDSERALASWGERLGAWLVDAFIIFFVPLVTAIAVGDAVWGEEEGEVLGYLVFAGQLVFGPAYFALLHATRRGQTLGKRAVGITVRSAEDAGRIGLGRALGRAYLMAVLYVAVVVPFVIDVLWPLWDGDNRALHDKAAGTLVVRSRHAASN